MIGLDDVAVFQIGDSAGDFEDAVKGASCKVKLLHGSAKQTLR